MTDCTKCIYYYFKKKSDNTVIPDCMENRLKHINDVTIEMPTDCPAFVEKNNTISEEIFRQNNPYTATLCSLKGVEYTDEEPDNVIRDRLLKKIEEEKKEQKKKLYVRWLDSGYSIRSDIWQTREEIENLLNELKEVETIGFVVAENDKWIVLAQSVNMDMLRGGYIILKSNILEQREV